MRMAESQNSRKAGFEKCPIPWKELIGFTSLIFYIVMPHFIFMYMLFQSDKLVKIDILLLIDKCISLNMSTFME